jgi:hypothetical protein
MENVRVFGGSFTVLSTTYDPVSQSWKTCQQSLFEDCQQSLEALPKSGMTVNGRLYQLHNVEHPTCDEDGLVLPTPTASDAGPAAILNENTNIVFTGKGTPRKVSNNGVNGSLGLARTVMLLPTPSAHEHKYRLKGNSQASRCLEARAKRTGKDFQLNPRFVEEMMGFPIGWTALEHLETQSSHSAQNGSDNK